MSQLSEHEREKCEAALEAARKALLPVFGAFCITARYEDENMYSSIQTDYHGHFSEIVGLANITLWRLQNRELNNIEREPDE